MMVSALKYHWPEYLMEAAGLGAFMVSASVFTMLLYHPMSPVVSVLPDEFVRRALVGVAMGLTAISIVYSPWGKRSGAHLNPAVTLTFLRLGKVAPWDAVFYILAQFTGAFAGVAFVASFANRWLANPSINYVATIPGAGGATAALLGEGAISFILMTVVLTVSNIPKLARFTGLFAGACVALFITFESPLSGMSMNPARTFGSAVLPRIWNAYWIYALMPPSAMLLAAALHVRLKRPVGCAKMYHPANIRCIFCDYHAMRRNEPSQSTVVPDGVHV